MKCVLLTVWLLSLRCPEPADLALINAVEDFVIEQESEAPIPRQWLGIAQELACDQYATRQHGSGRLLARSILDPRGAIWLRRSRSPEVRLRANAVLLRISGECRACEGMGQEAQHAMEEPDKTICRVCHQSTFWGRCPGECRDCHGTGRNWWKLAFD